MSSSLGSLVVSLGLDAAQYVSGLSKSEYQARQFVNNVTGTFSRAAGVIGALGASIGGALAVLGEAAGSIAAYQDLADQIGATAEEVAGLQLAADLSGKSLDTVAAASVRLTASLAKSDDEAKGVGAALAAINIPLKDFKQLDPVTQLETVAAKLAEFEDGAGKTAVAVALFGKAGAELIPFLNDLAETGGRNLRLTAEQIAAADEYAKAYDRLKGEAKGLAQVFVAESIPAAVGFLGAINDVADGVLGLGKNVGDLARDNGVRQWAEGAAIALGTVLESLTFVAKAVRALGGSFESVWADLKVAGGFAARGGVFGLFSAENRQALAQSLDARNKVVSDANKRYADLFSYNGTALTDAMRKRFAEGPAAGGGGGRPKLRFANPEGKGGANGGAKSKVSEAERYLESLQKQLEATQDLSVEEQLLQDIRMGRLGKVSGSQAEELAGIARQIDQVRAQRKADDELARGTIDRMNEERTAREKMQSDAARLYEQTRSPIEALNIEEAKLNQLLADGLVSWDTYARGVMAANDAYDEAVEKSKKLTTEQERAQSMAKDLGMTFSSAFEDAIVGGKGLSEVLQGLEQDILRIVTRKMVTEPMADWFGSIIKGASGGGGGGESGGGFGSWVANAIGSFFGGGRAAGGPVQAGKFYRVNERGTEMLNMNGRDYLMAGANGRVTPLGGGGGGGGVTVNMTVVARDAESFRRSEGQIASRLSGIASKGSRFR